MKVGDFFITLGMNADDRPLRRFSHSVRRLSWGLGSLGLLAVSTGLLLNHMSGSTRKSVNATHDLGVQTGLSTELMEAYAQAISVASGGIISTRESIKNIASLEKKINTLLHTGQLGEIFNRLGLDIDTKESTDAFDIYEQLRNTIRKTGDPTRVVTLLEEMGENPSLIHFLKASRKEIERFSKNVYLDDEQRENVVELAKTFTLLKSNMKGTFDYVQAKLAPSMNIFFNDVIDYIDKINSGLSNLSNNGFVKTFKDLSKSFNVVKDFVDENEVAKKTKPAFFNSGLLSGLIQKIKGDIVKSNEKFKTNYSDYGELDKQVKYQKNFKERYPELPINNNTNRPNPTYIENNTDIVIQGNASPETIDSLRDAFPEHKFNILTQEVDN